MDNSEYIQKLLEFYNANLSRSDEKRSWSELHDILKELPLTRQKEIIISFFEELNKTNVNYKFDIEIVRPRIENLLDKNQYEKLHNFIETETIHYKETLMHERIAAIPASELHNVKFIITTFPEYEKYIEHPSDYYGDAAIINQVTGANTPEQGSYPTFTNAHEWLAAVALGKALAGNDLIICTNDTYPSSTEPVLHRTELFTRDGMISYGDNNVVFVSDMRRGPRENSKILRAQLENSGVTIKELTYSAKPLEESIKMREAFNTHNFAEGGNVIYDPSLGVFFVGRCNYLYDHNITSYEDGFNEFTYQLEKLTGVKVIPIGLNNTILTGDMINTHHLDVNFNITLRGDVVLDPSVVDESDIQLVESLKTKQRIFKLGPEEQDRKSNKGMCFENGDKRKYVANFMDFNGVLTFSEISDDLKEQLIQAGYQVKEASDFGLSDINFSGGGFHCLYNTAYSERSPQQEIQKELNSGDPDIERIGRVCSEAGIKYDISNDHETIKLTYGSGKRKITQELSAQKQ